MKLNMHQKAVARTIQEFGNLLEESKHLDIDDAVQVLLKDEVISRGQAIKLTDLMNQLLDLIHQVKPA